MSRSTRTVRSDPGLSYVVYQGALASVVAMDSVSWVGNLLWVTGSSLLGRITLGFYWRDLSPASFLAWGASA